MVSAFQWKLIIAGSVGGTCAFVSSIVVFFILAWRHQRKLRKRAAERLNRRRLSAQSAETNDLVRGLNGVIPTADLPLPYPPDNNYIRSFGVSRFWLGQNSINHDSGCGDLESNRTDSASFTRRSFSPPSRSLNSSAGRTLPSETFPAMCRSDVDSSWSHSFDLLTPMAPFPNFSMPQSNIQPVDKSSHPVTSNILTEENEWYGHKSFCSDNDIQSSYVKPGIHDSGVQLVEFAHESNESWSRFPSCHTSSPSSSDNNDGETVWVRRTNVDPGETLTRSMVDCNKTDGRHGQRSNGNRSYLITGSITRDRKMSNPSRSVGVSQLVAKSKISLPDFQRNVSENQHDFVNPWEVRTNIGRGRYCVPKTSNRTGLAA